MGDRVPPEDNLSLGTGSWANIHSLVRKSPPQNHSKPGLHQDQLNYCWLNGLQLPSVTLISLRKAGSSNRALLQNFPAWHPLGALVPPNQSCSLAIMQTNPFLNSVMPWNWTPILLHTGGSLSQSGQVLLIIPLAWVLVMVHLMSGGMTCPVMEKVVKKQGQEAHFSLAIQCRWSQLSPALLAGL